MKPRTPALVLAASLVGLAVPVGTSPTASAAAPTAEGGYGGFSTEATATPLRIEIHDDSIPIPANPQLELNFSYSTVNGSTGPTAHARSSMLWPGDPVGTGLKTIVEQFGLPAGVAKDGYPVQANASIPGGPETASQQPLPGSVGRASANPDGAVARTGFSLDGDVADGSKQPKGNGAPPGLSDLSGLLGGLSTGDLSGLGAAMTGSKQPSATSPLGALGALVNVEGMSSLSRTDYSGDSVVATATSRMQGLSLLAGLIRLHNVQVVATTTSDLAGAKTKYQADFSGLSIAGKSFSVGRDGIEAAGQKTALPGLPDAPGKALQALGISFSTPKAVKSVDGRSGSMSVKGLKITLDTDVLLGKLPELPLGKLLAPLFDNLPPQAAQLKTVLEIALHLSPKFVIYVGNASSQAATVPPLSLPSGPTTGGSTPPTAAAGGSGGSGGSGGGSSTTPIDDVGGPASASGAPSTSTPVDNVSATPGLPPLGSVPTLLGLAGLAVAGLGGWWLRRAGLLLLGAGASCAHGLKSGIPDLRKVT